MPLRAAVLFVKGDWSEYVTSFGLPSWQDARRPCFACNASGSGLKDFEGAGPLSAPHREHEEGDYEAACALCEQVVLMTPQRHALIL